MKRAFIFQQPADGRKKRLRYGNTFLSTMDSSPIPAIMMMVLVWGVASVLLTMSAYRQCDLSGWHAGEVIPFSVYAKIPFDYVDAEATQEKRREAEALVPEYWQVSGERSEQIVGNFDKLCVAVRERARLKEHYRPGENNAMARLVADAKHFDDWRFLFEEPRTLKRMQETLQKELVRYGIAGKNTQKVKLILPDQSELPPRTPPTAREAAERLPGKVRLNEEAEEEFRQLAEEMIGSGNLRPDPLRTQEERAVAAAKVPKVIRRCQEGELLIQKGERIDRPLLEKIEAEKEKMPYGYGFKLFLYRMGISLLMLLAAEALLYGFYPEYFRSSRNFLVAGVVLILALTANYLSLQFFFHLFRSHLVTDYFLVLNLVPLPLGAALLSALFGNRVAVFGSCFIASVSSMMILPEQSFELALRWFAIGALTALAVRSVSNYRSFFVRVLVAGIVSTALVNGENLIGMADPPLMEMGIILCGNALFCAISSLLLIFVFELFCGVDTNMSLLLICGDHPLLERLKREAPGTYAHCTSVSSMAEDAARAIRANPLKAKAGALFHDIGKLSKPQYFVENNPLSPAEHAKMSAKRSRDIIGGHVEEGLHLAQEYRLSYFLRDAIFTHHGDDLVAQTYKRALEEREKDPSLPLVRETDFRYPGQPPTGKELTLISLADGCEAACRSLEAPTPELIGEMVDRIFQIRLKNGQLRCSALSLREFNEVRRCYLEYLLNFYHVRMPYQEETKP